MTITTAPITLSTVPSRTRMSFGSVLCGYRWQRSEMITSPTSLKRSPLLEWWSPSQLLWSCREGWKQLQTQDLSPSSPPLASNTPPLCTLCPAKGKSLSAQEREGSSICCIIVIWTSILRSRPPWRVSYHILSTKAWRRVPWREQLHRLAPFPWGISRLSRRALQGRTSAYVTACTTSTITMHVSITRFLAGFCFGGGREHITYLQHEERGPAAAAKQ